MKLLVVVRVPEPATGFVVSKSWCKTAFRWLEGQQERMQQHNRQQLEVHNAACSNRKNNKKTRKQRLKDRKHSHSRISNSSNPVSIPPRPANLNSDITCEHDQLQQYTSIRSARARRRLLDKQAWKILKVLYPESTTFHLSYPRLLANVSSVAPRRVRHRSSWSISRKRRDKNENYLSKILLCDAFIRAPAVFRNTICARIRQRQLRPQQAVASKSKDSFFRSASHESNIHTLLEQDANDDDDRKLPAKEMSLPEADAKVPMNKNHCQTVALEKSMCPFVEPAPCERTAHGAARILAPLSISTVVTPSLFGLLFSHFFHIFSHIHI